MGKIVIFTNFAGSPRFENYLENMTNAGFEYQHMDDKLSDEDTLKACEGADAVITCTRRFTREMIEALDSSVKILVSSMMGHEIYDMEAATERGIYVVNVPDYAMEEVAVHQTALILDCLRKVTYYDRKVHEGHYNRIGYLEGYPSRRVSAISIGLVGFGRIAKNVAKYFKAMGAKVCAYDPLLPDSVFEEHGVTRCETKEELCRICDVISPNTPLMPSSFHIIDEAAIAEMKDGVIIVNTGRGPLVDSAALIAGLQSGKIRAAGLDVHEVEPLPMDSPLLSMDNVILTPHIAYNTEEAFQELQRRAVEYAIEGGKGGMPTYTLNKEAQKNRS